MKTRNYIMATAIAVGLLVSTSGGAATISYDSWHHLGSTHVYPTFTVSDSYDGKFKVNIGIDKVNSPNDYADITGIFFDLDSSVIEADITGELVGDAMSGHNGFAKNTNKINNITTLQTKPKLGFNEFDAVLGYKDGNDRASSSMSFFVSDHNGALTLDDWGKVGIRFQAVGINGFGEGSDKEISTKSQLVAPIPAAVWLFGSGLMGLVGMTKRRKKS